MRVWRFGTREPRPEAHFLNAPPLSAAAVTLDERSLLCIDIASPWCALLAARIVIFNPRHVFEALFLLVVGERVPCVSKVGI